MDKDKLFYIIEEVDLSMDDGPGICERDFVSRMLARFSDNVIVFAPHLLRGDADTSKGIRFVIGHRDFNPIRYPLFQLHLLWTVLTSVLRHRPDAVIASPSIFPIVPFAVSTLLGIPLFSKTTGAGWRNRLPEKFVPFGRYILYPLAHIMFRLFLRRAHLIEVTTQQFIDDLSEEFRVADRERFVVVPNGVDTDLFRPLDQHQARAELGLTRYSYLVGWVGALTRYAGIEELINASIHVLKRYDNVGFVIVGDGEERDRLVGLVENNNLADNYLFVDHKPYESLDTYISALDVAVALWPTARMERIGPSSTKVPQYLACGTPVVASSGYDFLEDNDLGWLVVPEEPLAVADAICKALTLNEAQRKDMGVRARQYVLKELSMDSLVQKRYELWSQAVEKSDKRKAITSGIG